MEGTKQDFTFLSADGEHQIHAVLWPAEGETKAVVQIVHGISEYVERYAGFAAYLNRRGYAVAGHDHLGHGKTARGKEEYGCFPDTDGWFTVNRDVHQLREIVGQKYPGLPYFLLGHSMGSFQARTYLIDYPGTVDGCILSGTGQEAAPMVALGKAVAGALCRRKGPQYTSGLVTALSLEAYNKKFKPNRTTADWICRDVQLVDRYVADPLCSFVPTVGMFRCMMEGLQYIGSGKNLQKMDKSTPVAFFAGDADPVGNMGKGVKKVFGLFEKAGCRDLALKLYPGARHEILNETNKEEVYADMLHWLEQRL